MSKKLSQQFNCSKMMLPEHRTGLRQHIDQVQWNEEHRRPLLDEQRQEELQQMLEQAFLNRQALKVTILDEGGYKTCSGVPRRIDPAFGLFYLDIGRHALQPIKAAGVIRLEIDN